MVQSPVGWILRVERLSNTPILQYSITPPLHPSAVLCCNPLYWTGVHRRWRFVMNPRMSSIWLHSGKGFKNQYWNAVSFHDYGVYPAGLSWTESVEHQNYRLYDVDNFVSGELLPKVKSGTQILVTEYDPQLLTETNGTNGTLYGGIFAVEYALRMANYPTLLIGTHQLLNNCGIIGVDTKSGISRFLSAQAVAQTVAYPVFSQSKAVLTTKVTGGPTVEAIPGTGRSHQKPISIPAIYANSFTSAAGMLTVVLTNKSNSAVPVEIMEDGKTLPGPFTLTYVSNMDPQASNTAADPNRIVVQAVPGAGAVTIPPNSVVRVDPM
jgi:hypothetical protein